MALQLGKALRAAAAHSRQRLNAIRRSFVFREPRHVAQLGRERLAGLQRRARQALRLRWQETQQSVDELGLRLPRSLRALADRETQTIRRLDAQLRALNPLAVLERGYSLTQDERRAILRATAGMKSGQRVFTRLARGMFEAEVKQIHDEEKNG
jgi:exodeoxyribonuclease VII large subunit